MNDRNVISNLLNEISKLVDSKITKYKSDHTFKSTIWKINENGTYSINYKGQLYNVQNASGVPLSLGQVVMVKIPDGILRNMYIESVPNVIMSGSSGSSSSGDGHTHTNKSILDTITSALISTWNTVTNKVDKVEGKGLSTNDLTNELVEYWNNKSEFDGDYNLLTNKPTIPTVDGLASEDYVDDKISELNLGEENIQSDWNVTDTSSDAYIKNKPTIPDAYDDTALVEAIEEIESSLESYALKSEIPSTDSLVDEDTLSTHTSDTTVHITSTERALWNTVSDKLDSDANAVSSSKWEIARNINGLSINGSANRTNYCTCSTAAATAAKVVDCDGFELVTGASVKVRFTVTNTASNATLNVNSTGDKYIRYRNANINAGYLAVNRTYDFVYDGTYYQVVGDLDTNNFDRIRYSGTIKCSTTAIVANNIIVGSNGVYQHLKLGSAFDITYPILIAASAIAASATGNNNYKALAMTVTTTQSITLTAYKPVYIKGTLSGTTFTPVSTTPLTQTVPTTADGYQYILVGLAYSTTGMYLLAENPIYEYKNGIFRLYGAPSDSENKEIISDTEPTNQSVGDYWLSDYYN